MDTRAAALKSGIEDRATLMFPGLAWSVDTLPFGGKWVAYLSYFSPSKSGAPATKGIGTTEIAALTDLSDKLSVLGNAVAEIVLDRGQGNGHAN